MSAIQRRKRKKKQKDQCQVLESMCELVGIKIIYTRRNHVRLFLPSKSTLTKWELMYNTGNYGPEVSVGKQANKRFDDLLIALRAGYE